MAYSNVINTIIFIAVVEYCVIHNNYIELSFIYNLTKITHPPRNLIYQILLIILYE